MRMILVKSRVFNIFLRFLLNSAFVAMLNIRSRRMYYLLLTKLRHCEREKVKINVWSDKE